MAARIPLRLLSRTTRSHYARTHFSTSSRHLEASNFTMPAMSPTMTEGNIASWKVKEGDSFSQGDVLLEIETDKASMDVEAQDDGIMAKIFAPEGSKGVQVGTRIAVIAEPGDDISKIEMPADTSKPVENAGENVKIAKEEKKTAAEPEAPKGTPENKRPNRDQPLFSPQGAGQNPKYPLYPAVQALILAHHIPDSEVLKIAASGPGGRLLKGDVLAYLGSIQEDYSKKESERINKLGHLDLSNIKVMPQQAKPAAAGPTTTVDQARDTPKVTTISLTISLAELLKTQKKVQDALGVTLPLSTLLARAVDQANDDLPLPRNSKPSSDALFNAVLGLDTVPTTSRGSYLPQITALPIPSMTSSTRSTPSQSRPSPRKTDIIDILSGKLTPARSAEAKAFLRGGGGSSSKTTPQSNPSSLSPINSGTATAGAMNIFSITVPATEERRAKTFLERVKMLVQLDPGRLIL